MVESASRQKILAPVDVTLDDGATAKVSVGSYKVSAGKNTIKIDPVPEHGVSEMDVGDIIGLVDDLINLLDRLLVRRQACQTKVTVTTKADGTTTTEFETTCVEY